MPELIAIGDIHGMDALLERLLAQLPGDGELIFLGDYIDRGPDSRAVIARLMHLRELRPCHFLRGNHEAMLLAAVDGKRPDQFWLRNGGLQTLESYGGLPPSEHLDFLRQTHACRQTEEYIFVHAGLAPGVPLEQNIPDDLMWIRQPFLESDYDWGRLVIHGHTPAPGFIPDVRPNRINIDTGAVYGGVLTALLLPEREFISLHA